MICWKLLNSFESRETSWKVGQASCSCNCNCKWQASSCSRRADISFNDDNALHWPNVHSFAKSFIPSIKWNNLKFWDFQKRIDIIYRLKHKQICRFTILKLIVWIFVHFLQVPHCKNTGSTDSQLLRRTVLYNVISKIQV